MRLNEVYRKSGLGKWFHGESANKTPGWDRYNSQGKRVGECGDAAKGDPYSACLSKQKAQKLGKKGIANFVERKRAAQSAGGRGVKGSGGKGQKPIFVNTGTAKKRKVNENMESECKSCNEKSLFQKIKDKFLKEEAPLGKPFRTPGANKKFAVRVKNENGNIVTVRFGDPNMEIKRDDPDRRSNFRARHNCANPGPRTKARYWSCRMWEGGKTVSQLTKEAKDFTDVDISGFINKKVLIETFDGTYFGKLAISKTDYVVLDGDHIKKSIDPSEIVKIICEDKKILILEKNKPNDPDKWSDCKSQAKRKFDVYPSAYANAWAAKCYKKKGGSWRSVKEETEVLTETITKKDDKWILMNKAGTKVLGTHPSKKAAQKQEAAINISKQMHENLILRETLKDRFFSTKIDEEVVNADNVGKLTPQNTNPRAKSRDKIEKGLKNVKVIKGPPGRMDTPEEARFRLATFIELNKKGKKGEKTKKK